MAGVAGADAGVEAVAAGQEAGSAAHWAATDLGVKIESVSQNSGVCPAYRPSESYPKLLILKHGMFQVLSKSKKNIIK